MTRRQPLVLVCILAGCNVPNPILESTVSTIPPDSDTVTNMHVIRKRVERYLHENGEPPSSLEQLPAIPEEVARTTDGWGRQIAFVANGDTITLTSWGADGRPGGNGDNRDFIASMRVRQRSAEWVDPPRLD